MGVMLIGLEAAVLVSPLVVVVTVIVTGCVPVMLDRFDGTETLLHVIVVFVAVHGVLMFTEPQLVLLNVTVGFVPNPPPLMVTVNGGVPAVQVAGMTLEMLTGCTRVMMVVLLIPVSFW
jgi:hypothetical protein